MRDDRHDDFDAARVSAVDQAEQGMRDLAALWAALYDGLVARSVPEGTAADMVLAYITASGGIRGQGEG